MAAAPPGKTPKVMSSRLMTMKFMQRAVASSPSAPSTPDQSSNKKRKLSDSTGADSPLSDFQRIQAALAEEEAKRQKALEKQGAEVGETKWVLSFQNQQDGNGPTGHNGLRVVRAGYASLDSSAGRSVERAYHEDETWRPPNVGRKVFGQFKSASMQSRKGAGTSSSSDEDDEEPKRESDDDEESDPTGATALINAASKEATLRAKEERRAKRKAEKAESKRLADERRSKNVKLNELTSISGGGTGSGMDYLAQMQCHKCGEKGHKAKDCPTSGLKKKKRRKEERREVS